MSPVDRFREYLDAHDKRLTHERELVVEAVFSSQECFDAEQLVTRVARHSHRVSRATVFRTLSWLERAGLVRKAAQTAGRDVYKPDFDSDKNENNN
jgi:Fur family transcriptional regulator, ferric uptake regulator